MPRTISASLRLEKWATLSFEISSKDGFEIVYELKTGPKSFNPKQSCLCSNHNQKNYFIMNLNLKNFLSFIKKSSSLNILNSAAFVFVRLYQATFAQFLGGRCRYFPSCSHYALEAFENFTFLRATQLVFLRFISCHPLCKKPIYDPVPTKERKPYE